MSVHYEIIGVSCDGEALADVKADEGIETRVVEMTRKITPFQDLKATYQLYKLFKKEQPYIVHTHTPKAGTCGMLAAKLAGVPHRLHTVAGLPLLEAVGAKRKLLNVVEKLTYANATQVLPNSLELEKIILNEKFATKKKLKVIGKGSSNGIDTSHFDVNLIPDAQRRTLKKELKIQDHEIVFLFIGRLVKDKGVNELLRAFDNLYKTHSNCKLLLLGQREDNLDPLLPETENLIKSHPAVIAVGQQKDIRPFVAISDIFVFPSYREGFPNVLLQAGSMGLPSIVSDINGCNEIIANNVNGIIIPTKDFNAIEIAMKRLIENPEERMSLAKNARPRIIERFQREYVWNELLKNYKSLE